MVRGCQKKIVYLKNTGSEVFDEAYFVVSEKALENNACDMVEEANRILDECIYSSGEIGKLTVIKKYVKNKIIPFFIGMVFSILVWLLIK